jgi:hypothetical protein
MAAAEYGAGGDFGHVACRRMATGFAPGGQGRLQAGALCIAEAIQGQGNDGGCRRDVMVVPRCALEDAQAGNGVVAVVQDLQWRRA